MAAPNGFTGESRKQPTRFYGKPPQRWNNAMGDTRTTLYPQRRQRDTHDGECWPPALDGAHQRGCHL
eukprot:scaffold66597_cov33-Tisochrysis_lutea.AAC.5